MGKLDGKVALISGGARGQGAAEAETFAREGAKVVFGDIRDAEGQKVEATIRAHSGRPWASTSPTPLPSGGASPSPTSRTSRGRSPSASG